jgi:uncharacterized protein
VVLDRFRAVKHVLFILVLVIVIALAALPGIWVRTVMARHSADRPDFPGTGAEFARHLLEGMKLADVKVDTVYKGNYYDPANMAVRLDRETYEGRSLTAIVVAAHEVGHAMQHATEFHPLLRYVQTRTIAHIVERVGLAFAIALAPILVIVMHHGSGALIALIIALLVMTTTFVADLAALPVEFDASFNRALPILKEGRFIPESDLPAARSILRAAALTYVAGSFIGIFNILRWLRILLSAAPLSR